MPIRAVNYAGVFEASTSFVLAGIIGSSRSPPGLVPWVDNSLAVFGDDLEDVIRGFGPDERLRVFVLFVDPLAGVALELGDAAVGGPVEFPAGQLGEPALHKVEPR
jgi:hypothetical protein